MLITELIAKFIGDICHNYVHKIVPSNTNGDNYLMCVAKFIKSNNRCK